MPKEISCEKCGEPIYQIGPFARRELMNGDAQKFDGKFKFQCVNDKCIEYGKVIEKTDIFDEDE